MIPIGNYTALRVLTQPRIAFVKRKLSKQEAARLIRTDVLDCVGRLTPKWSKQIHAELVLDWGDVHLQTVLRAVRILIAAGQVRVTKDGYLRCRS